MSKRKICCCTKNNFVSKKKLGVAQKIFWCRQKQGDLAWKTVSYQQKKLMLHKKSISSRQEQDDTAQKNIFCSKKLLFFSGTACHKLLCLILALIRILQTISLWKSNRHWYAVIQWFCLKGSIILIKFLSWDGDSIAWFPTAKWIDCLTNSWLVSSLLDGGVLWKLWWNFFAEIITNLKC